MLATFALILIFSEGDALAVRLVPALSQHPAAARGRGRAAGRRAVSGLSPRHHRRRPAVALGLYLLIARTRLGMRIRAGESDREMIGALGVDIRTLYTVVFALGAALAGLAGAWSARCSRCRSAWASRC